ncbi:PE-PPE domain-containing protein [Mycolicibacterium sp. P9-22]|uniref:PE-PPE domain-containing protein n=1 Tax=Mycolicibacterium sp. P9-22 TaxID=2024613 RepID=UPI0011EDCA9E|nr:PE-PPE domain-containing protein [Mycolicibacterium sp. P9-22]KAA0116035.1 PE-PPE domain-containing protein [Mycolicibacterium sp. P9-22]
MAIARRSITTLLTVLTAVLITVASTLTMAVALAATALIVPGTGTPNANIVGDYLENARDYYISPFNPACTADNDCALQGIDYPAQFWPIPLPGWGGLQGAKWDVSTGEGLSMLNSTLVDTLAQDPPNTPVVIFGYSQGANIVSRQKRNLAGLPEDQTYLSFVMIGNTNRPNGGLFERLAFLGHVPILDATFGLPAPTDTCDHICATDIAFRYDGVADFPLYPLNALAMLNAIAGFWYVHGTYLAPNEDSDVGELPDGYTPAELAEQLANEDNWDEHGDTRYITIPTKTLPIVRPFLEFAGFTGTGFLIKPIVTLLTPVLEVLIEAGYDRSLSYGVPAPFRLIPRINPFVLARDVVDAIGEGIHDTFGGGSSPQQTPESLPTPVGAAAAAVEPADVAEAADVPEDTEPAELAESAESADETEETEEIDEPAERAQLTEARTSPKTAKSSTRSVRQAA